MQGVILSARTDQGLILGDDGNRYAFDPSEWRSDGAAPEVGVRVEFEVRGSDAADIYPIPGKAWRRWALAVGGAFVLLVLLGALALWVLGASGPPTGTEIARHSHEDRVYVLVEYGDELAVFSDSGPPVTQQELAEDIVHSYAWRLVLDDFDTGQLTDISPRVAALNDYTSGARDISNDVVAIFDKLESLGANVPFRGRVSAMEAVKEAYPGVGVAEILIRSLDSELNALSDNAAALTRASTRIPHVEPSSVSGDEMGTLFGEAAAAASDMEGSVRSVKDGVSEVRKAAGDLERALRQASATPLIGGTIGSFAGTVGQLETELSKLSGLLGDESEFADLEGDLRNAVDSAQKTLQADMSRWLQEPYDTEWPPTDPERRPAGGTEAR